MFDEIVLKFCGYDGLCELEEIFVILVMYNQLEVKFLGKKWFKVVNFKNNKKYSIEFYFVCGECKFILGLRVSEYFQLLIVNSQNIFFVELSGVEEKGFRVEDYILQYIDVFIGEGKLEGLFYLEIDRNVQLVQLFIWKVFIVFREFLKYELDRLLNIGVIQKVDIFMSWILVFVVIIKKNGKVRLCIDLKLLNEVLYRNYYFLFIIDDVLFLLLKV